MNYFGTLIAVADDCPVTSSVVPAERGRKKTVAVLRYEMIAARPYGLTQEDVLFETWLRRQEALDALSEADRAELRERFFPACRVPAPSRLSCRPACRTCSPGSSRAPHTPENALDPVQRSRPTANSCTGGAQLLRVDATSDFTPDASGTTWASLGTAPKAASADTSAVAPTERAAAASTASKGPRVGWCSKRWSPS